MSAVKTAEETLTFVYGRLRWHGREYGKNAEIRDSCYCFLGRLEKTKRMSGIVAEGADKAAVQPRVEGSLWKSPRGFFGGKWRKRFFQLTDYRLEYYHDLHLKGIIKITHQSFASEESTVTCKEEPAYFVFKVTSPKEKVYLASKTELGRAEWIGAVNTAAQNAKDEKFSANEKMRNIVSKRPTRSSVSGMLVGTFCCHAPADPKVELPGPPPSRRKDTGDFPPPLGNVRPGCMKAAAPCSTDLEDKKAGENNFVGLYCWGQNKKNQLGFSQSEIDSAMSPMLVGNMKGSSRTPYIVSCGAEHSMIITTKNTLYISGSGQNGQLGDGPKIKSIQRFSPLRLLKDKKVAQVSCGGEHTVCRLVTGEIMSWGSSEHGALGLGDEITVTKEPVVVAHVGANYHCMVERFTCGPNHTVFITVAGGVKSCGLGAHGQLGTGDSKNSMVPVVAKLFGGSKIADVGCGKCFTVFLSMEGNVSVCGQVNLENHIEEVERKTCMAAVTEPAFITLDGVATAVAAGDEHVLLLVSNDTVEGSRLYSFGSGQNGRLVHKDENDVSDPKLVAGLSTVPGVQIACGGAFSAMLSKGKSLFTFGEGHGGELGNGGLLDVNHPIRVEPPKDNSHFSFIACGNSHAFGLLSRGNPKGRGAHFANVGHYIDGEMDDVNLASIKLHQNFSAERECFYKDFDDVVYGPVSGELISHWFECRHVSEELLVTVGKEKADKGEFQPVRIFFSNVRNNRS